MPIELKTIDEVKDEVANFYGSKTWMEFLAKAKENNAYIPEGIYNKVIKAYGEHLLDYTDQEVNKLEGIMFNIKSIKSKIR